jgi:hypothetical protein
LLEVERVAADPRSARVAHFVPFVPFVVPKKFGARNPSPATCVLEAGKLSAHTAIELGATPANPGWALEINLDVEWAHAIAPTTPAAA